MSQASLPSVAAPPVVHPGAGARLTLYLLAAMVVAGAALRLSVYLANRSLWGDEAALALSIVPRGFAELSRPLEMSQSASLGFRYLLKAATLVLGPDAYGLRLVPLLAAVLTLPFMCLLARRLLAPVPALIAVALVAFNPWLIAYGAECKPYSMEVLAAVLTTWLALRAMDAGDPTRDLVVLGVVTAVLPWLGAGVTFIAGGAWIVVFLWVLSRRRPGRVYVACTACALGVLASAVASLWLAEPQPAVMRGLLDFWDHERAFPPLPWRGWGAVAWYADAVPKFFRQAGGFSAVFLALGLLVIGTAWLFGRRRWGLALLLAPGAAVLLAGLLHKYPLLAQEWPEYLPSAARLLLFLTPAMSILIAAGLGAVGNQAPRGLSLASLVLLVVLGFHPLTTTVERAIQPPRFQEMRTAWKAIAARVDQGDGAYVNPGGVAALTFYARLYPASAPLPFVSGYDPRTVAAWLGRFRARGEPLGRLWLVFVQHRGWDLDDVPRLRAGVEQALAQTGNRVEARESMDFPGVLVWAYTLRPAQPRPR